MVDLNELSTMIFNKVALKPKVNHDDMRMVGRRTREVAFNHNYIKVTYESLINSSAPIELISDMIIDDCMDRDYWYWHEKSYS